MAPQTQLASLGLNNKQSVVFLSCLELGPSTALEISRHSRIKRSTVYVILEELTYKKLIRKIQKGHTTLFSPEHPEKLGKQLEEQLNTFKNLQPLLVDLYNKETSKPNVKFYFGKEEIEQLYIDIMKQNSSVNFFGTNIELFSKTFPQMFAKVEAYIHDGKHVVREVYTHSPFNIKYAKKIYHPKFHKVRIIHERYQFFGDNALYGNTLLITSLAEPFAVTIESKDVAKTFNSLFEIAWDVSKPARDISLRTSRT